MYDLGPAFRNTSVDPGTNLLVSGPPLSGVRRLAFEAVAHGAATDDAMLVITTRYSAERVLADLDTLVDTDDVTLGIVDCVTRRGNRSHVDDPRVKYVTSPGALTRIGIKFSEFLKEFQARDTDRTRVALDSLSGLTPYGDTQSVFKFVHVLAGQLDDAGALGVHVVEPTAHDEETRRLLTGVFDVRATVRDDAVTDIEFD